MYAVLEQRTLLTFARHPDCLAEGIRRTLAYADLFRYPLAAHEVHRYLHDPGTGGEQVQVALLAGIDGVAAEGGYYAPSGRSGLAGRRRSRRLASASLSTRARGYGLLLKHLPYVRMVGLTGSLAMRYPARRSDIDLMIVTAPGRVWLCRAAVVAVVRLVGLGGDVLCPNYLVAEDALALDDVTIYDAHELAQMLPLYGREAYLRLWAANRRVQSLLPNARPRRMAPDSLLPVLGALKVAAERLLGGALGDRLERWELRRKSARLRRGAVPPAGESILSAQQCKGHFGAHRARILAGYAQARAVLEATEPGRSRHGNPRHPLPAAIRTNGSERG